MKNKEAYIEGMLHAASIADMEGSRRAANAIRTVASVMSGTQCKAEVPVEPLWKGVQGDVVTGPASDSEDVQTLSGTPQMDARKDEPKWFNDADRVKLLKACMHSKNLYGRCLHALKRVHTREAFVNNLSQIKGTGVKTEDALQRFRGMIWEV